MSSVNMRHPAARQGVGHILDAARLVSVQAASDALFDVLAKRQFTPPMAADIHQEFRAMLSERARRKGSRK